MKPDGQRAKLPRPAEGRTLTSADTAVSGDYRVQPLGREADDAPRFAVNPDLRESDNLDVLSDGEVETKLGFRPVLTAAGKETETVGLLRSTNELTPVFLLLLFAVACGEAAWAWYCGRAG